MQVHHLRKCYSYAVGYLTLEIEELKKLLQAKTTMAHVKPLLEKRLKVLEQDLSEIQEYQLD